MQTNASSKSQQQSPATSAVQAVFNFETLIYFDPATGAFRFDMTPRAPGTIQRECSSGGATGGQAQGKKKQSPAAAAVQAAQAAQAEASMARCRPVMHLPAAMDAMHVSQTKPKAGFVDACGIGVELVSGLPFDAFWLSWKSGIFIDSLIKGRGASAARAAGSMQLQEGDQIIQAGSVVVRSLQDAADALVGERGSEIVLLVERQYRRGSQPFKLWVKTRHSRFSITVTRS
jgi:hypothetical protein